MVVGFLLFYKSFSFWYLQASEKEEGVCGTAPTTSPTALSAAVCSLSLPPDPFMGVEYQTSTHFQLGDDKPPPASIYSNGTSDLCLRECEYHHNNYAYFLLLAADFAPESVRGTEKFLRAPPPPSSKVRFGGT